MRVDFYHLTATPLDRALPRIAERVLAAGQRLLIVAADEAQRIALDRLLWSYAADSFLPHAISGSEADPAQPVLITDAVRPANDARNVALVDGEWRDGALNAALFDRAFHFFDAEHIAGARAAWKSLAARDGVDRNYWKQDESGRWEQAA